MTQPRPERLERPRVPELERILGQALPVLDDGFVRVVDYMGDDAAVVQAARVSYGAGTRKVSDDRGLIRYLMRHRHTTPFEMCSLKLHVRVPMDAWRQWIRHRTASVNEYSTRYSVAIDAAQRTTPRQWRLQTAGNRQGSDGYLDPVEGEELSERERALQDHARAVYDERLALGVAREQARKDLPLCTYTEAYWKMDLHNLLHFLNLRMEAHAQEEIRAFARLIGEEIVARWVPLTWEAFLDYRFHAQSLSRLESRILAALGRGDAAAACEVARAAGWLAAGPGGLKRHRERQECETKLAAWSLPIPWQDAASGTRVRGAGA
jgi:thymidylate synthase (FAD)